MENILVFRTALPDVMDMLFKQTLRNDTHVECLIQHASIEEYKSKYPEVKFTDIQKTAFDPDDKELIKRLNQSRYSKAYIPSSSPYFTNFDNVIFLAYSLNAEEILLYNCYGKMQSFRKKSALADTFDFMFTSCVLSIYKIFYRAKCLFAKEG
jgi:hypothetical protein